MNEKKEALLEKELILEEVTALSEKLRHQASVYSLRIGAL